MVELEHHQKPWLSIQARVRTRRRMLAHILTVSSAISEGINNRVIHPLQACSSTLRSRITTLDTCLRAKTGLIMRRYPTGRSPPSLPRTNLSISQTPVDCMTTERAVLGIFMVISSTVLRRAIILLVAEVTVQVSRMVVAPRGIPSPRKVICPAVRPWPRPSEMASSKRRDVRIPSSLVALVLAVLRRLLRSRVLDPPQPTLPRRMLRLVNSVVLRSISRNPISFNNNPRFRTTSTFP